MQKAIGKSQSDNTAELEDLLTLEREEESKWRRKPKAHQVLFLFF
jgi:hypothetical protein